MRQNQEAEKGEQSQMRQKCRGHSMTINKQPEGREKDNNLKEKSNTANRKRFKVKKMKTNIC